MIVNITIPITASVQLKYMLLFFFFRSIYLTVMIRSDISVVSTHPYVVRLEGTIDRVIPLRALYDPIAVR